MTALRQRVLVELGLAPSWTRRSALSLEAAAELGRSLAAATSAFTPDAIATMEFDLLPEAIGACTACARHASRQHARAGAGPQHARLVVIDQVPRHRSGDGAYLGTELDRLLEQILFSVGLAKQQVYLSHLARCDGGVLQDEHVTACAPYLKRELELIAPRALLVLGARADTLLERSAAAARVPRFVIEHPSALLGQGEAKRAAWQVLAQLRRTLRESAT